MFFQTVYPQQRSIVLLFQIPFLLLALTAFLLKHSYILLRMYPEFVFFVLPSVKSQLVLKNISKMMLEL